MIISWTIPLFRSHGTRSDFQVDQDEETELQIGNRALTVRIYLNDGAQFQGGETVFTHLDVTVSPRVGTAIIWANVLNERPTEKDWRTSYEARPVEAGTEFSANFWITTRPFRSAWKEFTCADDNESENSLEPEIKLQEDDREETDATKAEL